LKKRQLILGLVVLLALVGLAIYAQHRYPIDWREVLAQFEQARWSNVAIGMGCIYVGYAFRAVRWAWLLRHNKRVSPSSLVGTQVIGFTAVALIGRVADPVRPYLVAKKTSLPLSSQIAVYIVERLFDAGTMALIFSSTILLTTWFGAAGAVPHPELVKKSGYWGLAGTLAGALFLVAVRFAGGGVASFLERSFGMVSKRIGQAIGNKVREFQTGLDTMRSFSDFAVAAALSICMWLLIALAYLVTTRAFVASPELATMTPAKCVLLMIVSGVSSVVQLPVVGWFTQIGLVAIAISQFFGVAREAATACAATILLVTFICIIPVGLLWAQFENINLRKVAEESEVAEQIAADQTASAAE
jgi:glycosyltransferase 2 family protein